MIPVPVGLPGLYKICSWASSSLLVSAQRYNVKLPNDSVIIGRFCNAPVYVVTKPFVMRSECHVTVAMSMTSLYSELLGRAEASPSLMGQSQTGRVRACMVLQEVEDACKLM